MGEERTVPSDEAPEPGIVRKVGGFLLNISLLALGAYVIGFFMESQFPFEAQATDITGTRQFLSSTATLCGTLASFLFASLAFVMSSRGSRGFFTMIKRGDFDIPMIGLAIVFLIYQAVSCVYYLGILSDPGVLDADPPLEPLYTLSDIVRRTMSGTITTVSVLLLAIWSSGAPKVVNAIIYGIGKVKI